MTGKRKQRLDQAGEMVPTKMASGSTVMLKKAGMTVTEMARYSNELLTDPYRTSNVPCKGCTACCHFRRIDVDPTKEPPERLAHLSLTQDSDGVIRLNKNRDGSCAHLVDNKCSVYEHRPTTCRKYDCRVMGVLGITPVHDGGHMEPQWLFDVRTEKDAELYASISSLRKVYVVSHDPVDPIALAHFIAANVSTVMDANINKIEAAMNLLTPQEQQKAEAAIVTEANLNHLAKK